MAKAANLVWVLALLLLAVAAASPRLNPKDIVVDADLDYGSFRGAYSDEYNITHWTTVPFVAPPVGRNRFRAPQPLPPLRPSASPALHNASRPFPMCPQREASGDEDCLYLGVYGRPWTTAERRANRLRPVVVVFFGGGFIRGSAALGLPPAAYPVLNVSEANNVLFVYPNYRTNAFGFLAGRDVGADAGSDTNAGLLDQQAALRWVQRYIHAFGGDAGSVSIWGQSAGGGGVLAQVVASSRRSSSAASGNETAPPLFHRAMASSPYWPKTYRYDAPEPQALYDDLVRRVGCEDDKNDTSARAGSDTLACLKAVDVQALRTASLAITADRDATATSSYAWAPVLDDTFLRQPLSSLTRTQQQGGRGASAGAGTLRAGFATYNTHEGENFVPTWLFPKRAANATADDDGRQFHTWLLRYLPTLNADDVAQVGRLYPLTGDVEDGRGADRAYSDGNPFGRAGLVYRDVTLACPAYWMTTLAATSWLAEYSISPAKHASDTYWWNTVDKAQKTDPLHYNSYAGALASFFATGDPNANKLTASSVPGLHDTTAGEEWAITADGFATWSLAQLQTRCDFWLSIAPRVSI
ncbi:hypothetical protein HMPREF1624_03232 [Sporothrix schenckii ATCC 58251]|uniref:Carboxylic ester hydrolase n=1 Tax=Sporothrix schenckii (strain ATCC 58251 / de Perez 2211183) TaxID=1391915 RepID=U7PY39_SPOS1|nr:hypothetical protein HMPREF1624_03232 [Sporothrix schenckii ATCC 58251]